MNKRSYKSRVDIIETTFYLLTQAMHVLFHILLPSFIVHSQDNLYNRIRQVFPFRYVMNKQHHATVELFFCQVHNTETIIVFRYDATLWVCTFVL
ncbi:MAG: hypothetical protein EBX37_18230 [Alphaproteobacteria bacterium]|nr:hypothetical protein [Alphaproteobacteria bacterium]